jgi:hypothetical protein
LNVQAPTELTTIATLRGGDGIEVVLCDGPLHSGASMSTGAIPIALLVEENVRGRACQITRIVSQGGEFTAAHLKKLASHNNLTSQYLIAAHGREAWILLKRVGKFAHKETQTPAGLDAVVTMFNFVKAQALDRKLCEFVAGMQNFGSLWCGTLVATDSESDESILTYAQTCDALHSIKRDDWRALVANSKRAIKLKCGTPLHKAIVCMKMELQEFLDCKWQASDCVYALDAVEGPTVRFPEDFTGEFRSMVGRTWDPVGQCIVEHTFEDHQTGSWHLRTSAFIVGSAGAGKSTAIVACARHHTVALGTETYIMTKTLDALGLLTKAGSMRAAGCYCFVDFDARSLMNTNLTAEGWKSLLDVEEGGSIPARYHVATFSRGTPKLFGINLEKSDVAYWSDIQGAAFIGYLADNNLTALRAASSDDQAAARRVSVFVAPSNCLLSVAIETKKVDVEVELTRRRANLAARAAK